MEGLRKPAEVCQNSRSAAGILRESSPNASQTYDLSDLHCIACRPDIDSEYSLAYCLLLGGER